MLSRIAARHKLARAQSRGSLIPVPKCPRPAGACVAAPGTALHRIGLLKIDGLDPFEQPVMDRSEKLVGLGLLLLNTPEPRHAHRRSLFFKGEYALPVVLHTDDGPALLFCLLVQRLREGADLGVG